MNLLVRHDILASAFLLFGTITCLAGIVEVESGTAIFTATTNVPGVEVKGKSTTLSARVEVSPDANGLVLQGIEASLPVKSLVTGMKVRDEHMRKYIFCSSGRTGTGSPVCRWYNLLPGQWGRARIRLPT